LQWATRLLDEQCRWAGLPTTLTQALGWPRYGTFTRNGLGILSTAIPGEVKDATAELARRLIDTDLTAAADEGTIGSKTVGPLSISYASPAGARTVPPSVEGMVRHLVLARMTVRA
jgi:hypothetical protein